MRSSKRRKLIATYGNFLSAKTEIKDFKQTPAQINKVLMQCIVDGNPSPEVTWYLQNSKLPDTQKYPDYDVTASKELLVPAAALVSNSFLCNCTNPLDSVAMFARGECLVTFVEALTLYKVVVTFESVCEILKCDHSSKCYLDKILKCDH